MLILRLSAVARLVPWSWSTVSYRCICMCWFNRVFLWNGDKFILLIKCHISSAKSRIVSLYVVVQLAMLQNGSCVNFINLIYMGVMVVWSHKTMPLQCNCLGGVILGMTSES